MTREGIKRGAAFHFTPVDTVDTKGRMWERDVVEIAHDSFWVRDLGAEIKIFRPSTLLMNHCTIETGGEHDDAALSASTVVSAAFI